MGRKPEQQAPAKPALQPETRAGVEGTAPEGAPAAAQTDVPGASEAAMPEEAPAAPETVSARITTDRGPFWSERPMLENEIASLPPDVFAALEERGWAERIE